MLSPGLPVYAASVHVPVAQLDRALASGAKGRRFDSCRVRHFNNPYPEFS